MKKFFKRVLYTLTTLFFVVTLLFHYLSNRVVEELESINRLHYENSYLTDAAIICMQLYLIEPTQINQDTCVKIEDEIKDNVKELNSYTIASMYLNYMDSNR